MLRFRHILAAAVVCGGWLAAADTIAPPAITPDGIANAASRMPATLGGGAVAGGARIIIPGVRLGPDTAVRGDEADPPTQVAGVSVRIRQGDRVVNAGLLLVSAERIDAWLPPALRAGDAQLTVTYQGRTSEPYALAIVAVSAGIFSSETAPHALLSAVQQASAAPGEPFVLWATGLSDVAPDVFVGGQPAGPVGVTAAACCRGVERVEFRVAPGAPHGCFVPVLARTADGRTSNAVHMEVHAPGQPCRDEVDWFRESVEHADRAGFVVLAHVSLDVHPTPRAGEQFDFDYGVGSFGRQEAGQRVFPPLPPLHTCTVFTAQIDLRQMLNRARAPAEWTSIPQGTAGNRRLDAGAAVSIAGPAGVQALNRDARRNEYYDAVLGGKPPLSHQPARPLYLREGTYTVSAPGGSDIGPFSSKLDVPGPIQWKNRARVRYVKRAEGVTLAWKAANAGDIVLIVAANADRFSGASAMCLCLAPARDGHFRIPPLALSNLPPTLDDSDLSASYMLLAEIPLRPPARIEARGLDSAFAAFVSSAGRLVRFH
jgi:uncharacterized protein (TIGR03437 family)